MYHFNNIHLYNINLYYVFVSKNKQIMNKINDNFAFSSLETMFYHKVSKL